MALSEVQIAKLKVDVEVGKLSKTKIAQKHSISRNTLDKYIKDEGWFYARNQQELSERVEKLTTERLIQAEVDRATKITEQYIKDVDTYRRLAMIPASELVAAYNDAKQKGTKVTRNEFARIKESTLAIKNAIETLNTGYTGNRKALGMDIEADVSRQRQLKQQDKQSVDDPTEGLTEDQIDQKLKEFE